MTTQGESEVIKWQEERAARLKNEEKSWLGLAGLYWLKEGENPFGSDPTFPVILPEPAPKRAGIFIFKKDQVTLIPEKGVSITCNGSSLPDRPLLDDQKEKPDYLELGQYILVVIKRGSSTLIRFWDKDSPLRKTFTGLNFYPYQSFYSLVAEYVGYSPYKMVKQKDIIGEVHDTKMIGTVSFNFQGKRYQLDAEDAGDGLFIAFRDRTNSQTTYAGGRYLLTEKPRDGKVVLDFNKAYNMPCAYTVYATCGLPTQDNRLPVFIEAGEKKFSEDH